jgi:hypothetical protein
VTIQAVESSLGQLAPRQVGALVEHYGFDMDSARYFACLAERAAGNAALGEAALTSPLPLVSPRVLVRQAETACRSYVDLLDGVQILSERSSGC